MSELHDRVNAIAEDTSKTVKERVDELLELDKANHAEIGLETSKTQKKAIYAESRIIYRAIKGLDKDLGNLFLRTSDK